MQIDMIDAAILMLFLSIAFFASIYLYSVNNLQWLKILCLWLPLQTGVAIFLFSILDLPIVTKSILLLKEFYIFPIAIIATVKFFGIKWCSSDKWFAAFAGLNLIYLFIPDYILGVNNTFESRVLGFRANILPVVLYVIGRISTSSYPSVVSLLRFNFITAFIISVFGFAEYLSDWEIWVHPLKYQEFREFINVGVDPGAFDEGLRPFFFTSFEGAELRRMVSLYGNPLHLSFYLAFSILFYTSLNQRFSALLNTILYKIYFFIICAAFLLTVTRGPFLSISVSYGFYWLKFSDKKRFGTTAISTAAILIFVGALFGDMILNIIINTVNLSDGSSMGHFSAYLKAFNLIPDYPLGIGLGQSGSVGAAYGSGLGLGESLYFNILSEIGWLGFIIFLMSIISSLSFINSQYDKSLPDSVGYKLLSNFACTVTLFYALGSLNTEQWRGISICGIYWIMLGLLVGYKSRLNRSSNERYNSH